MRFGGGRRRDDANSPAPIFGLSFYLVLGGIVALPLLHVWIGRNIYVYYSFLVLALALAKGFSAFKRNKQFHAIQMSNVDSMTGIEFEQFLQRLLTFQGYEVSMTKGSGDLGVDLIALRNGDTIAIQAKRSNSKISRRAISDAVAGRQHYRCGTAMVITNSHFTPGAMILARSTNCILVDRAGLTDWILAHQKS